MWLLAGLSADSGYLTGILPSFVMIGLGMGAVLPGALELSTFGVAPHEAGIARSRFNVAHQAGSTLDTALLNTVAVSAAAAYGTGAAGAAEAQVHGFTTASTWAGGILALAAVVAIVLMNTRLNKRPAPEAAADASAAPV